MTPQRRAIAEVLTGEHVHLTAETVHARAIARLPEISLATVYNTLNELVAMGEVTEVAAGPGPKRYDPNVAERHHHLVCTSCGALLDVPTEAAGEVELDRQHHHGYTVTGVTVVFQGRCPDCARA